MKKVYLFFMLFLLYNSSFSQPKFLDKTFGNKGYVTTDFGSLSVLYSLAVQSDDKVVAAGVANGDFAVARYKADGSADGNFGTGGKVVTDFGGTEYGGAAVVQPDGKIVVAGYTQTGTYPNIQSKIAMVRYNMNGSLDSSFGAGGKVITTVQQMTYVYAIARQTDGKIVITGSTSDDGNDIAILLARYKVNGTLDSSFGTNGFVESRFDFENEAYALGLQPDGKILVAGYTYDGSSNTTNSALVRYQPNGQLDSSFALNGLATDYRGVASALAIQADGKIIEGGRRYNDNYDFYGYLVRKNPDGSADAGYRLSAGSYSDSKVFSLLLQPDGKALVSISYKGSRPNTLLGVLRLTPAGKPDTTFGNGGVVAFTDKSILFGYPPANPLAMCSSGKILLGATLDNHFAVARFLSGEEATDRSQPQTQLAIRAYPNPASSRLTVDGLDKNLPAVVTITTVSGYVLTTYKLAAGTVSIDVSALKQGQYTAVFVQGGKAGSVKFMKQ